MNSGRSRPREPIYHSSEENEERDIPDQLMIDNNPNIIEESRPVSEEQIP